MLAGHGEGDPLRIVTHLVPLQRNAGPCSVSTIQGKKSAGKLGNARSKFRRDMAHAGFGPQSGNMPACKAAGIGVLIIQRNMQADATRLPDAVADNFKPSGRQILCDQPGPGMDVNPSKSGHFQGLEQLGKALLATTGLILVVQDKKWPRTMPCGRKGNRLEKLPRIFRLYRFRDFHGLQI